MRLILPCRECLTAQVLGGAFAYAEYRDDNCYESVCPAGHKTISILQQQRFELLFEIGAYAIVDGYYREAVTSFAASLERFYEFATRVLFLESSGSESLFQNTWKSVSSQSERQLGAFAFVWALRFREIPSLLSQDLTKFRNDVVHKGRIPSNTEAIEFGGEILKRLAKMIDQLEKDLPDQILQVTHSHLRSITPTGLYKPVSTMALDTIVSLSRDKKLEPIRDLPSHLLALNEKRRSMDSFIKLVQPNPDDAA